MRSKAVSLLLALAATAPSLSATAANDANIPFETVTVYAGHGIDHDLPQIPGAMMRGRWRWQESYFAGAGFGNVRGTLGQSFDSLRGTMFANVRHGYEIVVLKHHGMQSNAEVGAAYALRTPDLHAGPLGVNFSAGGGLSYAIGNPTYEDGPEDDPARRYRLQALMLFELEWHLRGFEHLAITTRVHHRCGVYGLIAPRHVGSNFLVAGVRYSF
jgi:hypothetical protein